MLGYRCYLMLPNGEFNVNSGYAQQSLQRETPRIPNLPHCRPTDSRDAGVGAHRALDQPLEDFQ